MEWTLSYIQCIKPNVQDEVNVPALDSRWVSSTLSTPSVFDHTHAAHPPGADAIASAFDHTCSGKVLEFGLSNAAFTADCAVSL